MTKPLRVLIVDDDTNRSTGWKDSIARKGLAGDGADVGALTKDECKDLINRIDARRRDARAGKDPFGSDSPLDAVDILVLDYDLEDLQPEVPTSTGLLVAMLARAFSRARLIILVNQFGSNKFDLTMTAAARSNADFDVNEAQLLNPALWVRSLPGSYAPWSWGNGIRDACERMSGAIEWVRSRLDAQVLESLGFGVDGKSADTKSLIAKDLWQECVEEPTKTFRQMVFDARFLTPKDREAIERFDESCCRVAAALVVHWLERWVIPANEVLIDLPHLASASPWLLIKRDHRDGWHATVGTDGFDALLPGVRAHAYELGPPLARPAVWRERVSADENLREPSGFRYDDFPDLVFCENTSTFEQFDIAQPFTSRLPVSDPQRFVLDKTKVAEADAEFSIRDVVHEPQVLFAI